MILRRVVVPRAERPGLSASVDLERVRTETIDIDAEGARSRLGEMYMPPRRTWLRINLVAGVDGSVVGSDGGSDSLTNSADRMLLGVIRSTADVVLVGAASVRAEGLHLPRRARLAIVTATGSLGDPVVPDDLVPRRILVIGPPAAVAEAERRHPTLRAEYLETVPDGIGSWRGVSKGAAGGMGAIVDALRSRGLLSIVCEGGPTLAGRLLDAGLVDELCLTTSPVLGSSRLPLGGGRTGDALPLDLTQLLIDDRGATYARWAVPRR